MSISFDDNISDVEDAPIPNFFKFTGKYTVERLFDHPVFKGHPMLSFMETKEELKDVIFFPYKSIDSTYRFLGNLYEISGGHEFIHSSDELHYLPQMKFVVIEK